MRIRIGNQTAISAARAELPFEFAVAQGFDAFEWFPDRNAAGAGWTEDNFDREQRASFREIARARDIRLSVHAPWWASPIAPESCQHPQQRYRLRPGYRELLSLTFISAASRTSPPSSTLSPP